MNAERLSLIARSVIADINEYAIIDHLGVLTTSLSKQINEPNEENQQSVSENVKELYAAINQCQFSRFPKTWRTALEELGIYDILGAALKRKIESILGRNQLTYVDARDQITNIQTKIVGYYEAFENLVNSFDFLDITGVGPEAGEAELSVVMPRDSFNNELKGLAEQILFFNAAVAFLSEIAAQRESRETPAIRQLSTTDPMILFAMGLPTVYLVLQVVEKIQDIIGKTYNLRKIRADMEKAQVDSKISRSMKGEIDKVSKDGLNEIHDWLFKTFPPPGAGRANELKIEAEKILRGLAKRVDEGYEIDGDAGEFQRDQEEGEEPDSAIQKQIYLARKIKEISRRIGYTEIPHEPTLELPKHHDGDDEGDRSKD